MSVYSDPLTVRLTRWGRKQRIQISTAAAVLVVTVAAFGLVASFQVVHARALDIKNTDLTEANAVKDFERRKAEEREQLAIAAVKRFGDAVSKNTVLKNNSRPESLR